MILHSFSGGWLIHGMSTRFKGKFGTSQRILDVNATLCPPGTLAATVIVVDIKSLIDLQNSSSTSAISEDPLPGPSFPVGTSDLERCCSTRAPQALALSWEIQVEIFFSTHHISAVV